MPARVEHQTVSTSDVAEWLDVPRGRDRLELHDPLGRVYTAYAPTPIAVLEQLGSTGESPGETEGDDSGITTPLSCRKGKGERRRKHRRWTIESGFSGI